MALFNMQEAAQRFMEGRREANSLELCALPAVTLEDDTKGIAFTTTGLGARLPTEQQRFLVLVDPERGLRADGSVRAAQKFALDILGLRDDEFQLVTVPVTPDTERLWMWRIP